MVFFQWLELTSLSIEYALLEWRFGADSLRMHVWPVDLAAEALVRRHSQAEVAYLDVDELKEGEDEWEAKEKHE